MGMDVFGREPVSEKGKYFRSNIWGWPTILNAIAATEVLPKEMIVDMSYNQGAGPDADLSIKLADALDEALNALPADGVFISDDSEYTQVGTATLVTQLVKQLTDSGLTASTPGEFSADVAFIKEFAAFCRDSGGFEVW